MGREAVICEEPADGFCNETLVGDLRICGVWQSQVDAMFDVCVVDTSVPSYRSRSPETVLRSAEAEKKYKTACVARCGGLTPLCFSVDSILNQKHQLANRLSSKWEKPYSLAATYMPDYLFPFSVPP